MSGAGTGAAKMGGPSAVTWRAVSGNLQTRRQRQPATQEP